MAKITGVAKITGAATFAADNHPDGLLYAVYVPATIARGTVTHLTGRPVKLMLRRDQMFGPVGHRGATRQRLRIGIDGSGLTGRAI